MDQLTGSPPTVTRSEIIMRQQLLLLCLGGSDLSSPVVAWSHWDGRQTADAEMPSAPAEPTQDEHPPYRNALAALRDGWRLIHWPSLAPLPRTAADELGPLSCEFVFEKWEPRHV